MRNVKSFNNSRVLPEGWFWLLPSSQLKTKRALPVKFWGRELAVWRGADGNVRCVDAYCPHMGAHLGDGLVEENKLRCLFHNWRFNESGRCDDIPCQKEFSGVPSLKTHRVGEKYGLIWIWTGAGDAPEIPVVPDLQKQGVASALGKPFVKECHPNVMMINAIDAQHFNTVHNVFVDLDMQPKVLDRHCIQFSNATRVPRTSVFTRFISRFYSKSLTYEMTYWFGNTGTVKVGPDFLHFFIMFALRPTLEGKSEGQTVLFTKARPGVFGRLVTPILLFLSKVVGNYFAKGDTVIFSRIKFNFRSPIRADHAIVSFIQHFENQTVAKDWSHPENYQRSDTWAPLSPSNRIEELSQ